MTEPECEALARALKDLLARLRDGAAIGESLEEFLFRLRDCHRAVGEHSGPSWPQVVSRIVEDELLAVAVQRRSEWALLRDVLGYDLRNAAYEELVVKRYVQDPRGAKLGKLYWWVYNHLKTWGRHTDPDLIECLIQALHVKLLAGTLDKYDPTRPFAPWLWMVVRNHVIDWLRRDLAGPVQGVPEGAESAAYTTGVINIAIDIAEVMVKALKRYEGKERRWIRARFFAHPDPDYPEGELDRLLADGCPDQRPSPALAAYVFAGFLEPVRTLAEVVEVTGCGSIGSVSKVCQKYEEEVYRGLSSD